jgi:hypothetical protein
MIDVEKLLKTVDLIKVGRNKFFGYVCYRKKGIWEVQSITVRGIEFRLPKLLRKLTRHKERF